ncbi:DUF4355 domain-containing protein [Eubacteriaceae bacterium ES2]|nr:DUF4355 domain-containing protein [Eubacteriaceae bacterium ES2]
MENVADNVMESNLTGDDPGAVETKDGKTFSQDQVNEIVRDRLAKEKEKTQKKYEAMEQEFKNKELNFKAKELLSEKGISLDILDALKYEDEETLMKSIEIVEKALKLPSAPPRYEPKAGGESPSTDDQIREWMGLK